MARPLPTAYTSSLASYPTTNGPVASSHAVSSSVSTSSRQAARPPASESPGRLLTVRDVARVLGVSAATVCRLVSDGDLVHVRVLNAIRVRPDDLRSLVSCCEHGRE